MSGLYIHIPFCEKRCGYCDFYSTVGADRIDDYLDAFAGEMALYSSDWFSHEFQTLFIGGGTPSMLTPDQLRRLFRSVHEHFTVTSSAEISSEANPRTLSDEKLRAFLDVGVNRLSVGVQSFNEDELNLLGRIHTAEVAKQSILDARSMGFKNIGLDLIFGLPRQTLRQWRDSVERAVELEPDHISAYSLTWSEQTLMGRRIISGQLPEPDESVVSEMFLYTHEYLAQHSYEHYEISNYAKPGSRCKHNWNYWNGTPYLGLGASAHVYDQNRRWSNVSDVDVYINQVMAGKRPIAFEENLTQGQKQLETVSLGLRTCEGILLASVDSSDHYVNEGYALIEEDRFVLTPKGMLIADEIAQHLI